jgi:hypothetical protein
MPLIITSTSTLTSTSTSTPTSAFAFASASASAGSLDDFHWPKEWYGTWRFWNNSQSGEVLNYGLWYYDYPNQFLRQDNNGSFCPDPMNPGEFVFCEGIFNLDTFFFFVPSQDLCCTCIQGLGMSAPNWIDGFASNVSFEYNVLYTPLSVLSNSASFVSDRDNNSRTYYQSAVTQLPVALRVTDQTLDPTENQWVDIIQAPVPKAANNLPLWDQCSGDCPSSWFCSNFDAFLEKRPSLKPFLKAL